jgi:prolyl-tRNA synthetase
VVLLPILRSDDTRQKVLDAVQQIAAELRGLTYGNRPVEVEVDKRDVRGGQKKWDWVKKGIPIRLEIGPRDVDREVVSFSRRDQPVSQTQEVPRAELAATVLRVLADMQEGLLARAREFRAQHMRPIGDWTEFVAFFTPESAEKPEIHGGFAVSPWCGNPDCETRVKDELKVTIRCIPLDEVPDGGLDRCVVCGGEKKETVVFAKNY